MMNNSIRDFSTYDASVALYINWNESTNNSQLVIKSHFPMNGNPFRNLPFNARLSLSVALVFTFVIGTHFKILLYKGIFRTKKIDRGWMRRPINILIFLSSIIHHTTHLITCTFGVLALLSDKPPQSIFGTFYCSLINAVTTFGIVYMSSGSFGIALYRIMYIRFENLVKYHIGEKNLLLLISWGGIGITSGISYMHKIEESSLRVATNICFGISPQQAQTLIDYRLTTDNLISTSDDFQKIAVSATLMIMLLELMIYIYIGYWRYRHENGDITKLLDPTVTKRRNKNNIITFMGQFYEFIVEFMILTALLLLNHIKQLEISSTVSHLLVSISFIVYLLNFGILSATQVLLSPACQTKT